MIHDGREILRRVEYRLAIEWADVYQQWDEQRRDPRLVNEPFGVNATLDAWRTVAYLKRLHLGPAFMKGRTQP